MKELDLTRLRPGSGTSSTSIGLFNEVPGGPKFLIALLILSMSMLDGILDALLFINYSGPPF